MATRAVPINPRAARTRAALIDAGFALLEERPIDAIAIDDIVARAGVAKGSFFNHFTDKPGFAQALGQEVRAGLEAWVTAANRDVQDPVLRLAGGMREAVRFALDQRSHAIVMLRGLEGGTGRDHALNAGVRADVARLVAAGLTRAEAERSGMRFWLGLCQVAMLNVLDRRPDRADTARRLEEMLVLGLTGLGIAEERARAAASWTSAGLLTPVG